MLLDQITICTTPASDIEQDARETACFALMKDLGISGADGINHDSAISWSNTFYGRTPANEELARAAEAHGFDLAWGVETHADEVWSATFVSVAARDPAYAEALRTQHEEGLIAAAPNPEAARAYLADRAAFLAE